MDVEIGFIVGFNVEGQNMGIMKISYFLFTNDIELFCEEILNVLITYEYDSTKFYCFEVVTDLKIFIFLIRKKFYRRGNDKDT